MLKLLFLGLLIVVAGAIWALTLIPAAVLAFVGFVTLALLIVGVAGLAVTALLAGAMKS